MSSTKLRKKKTREATTPSGTVTPTVRNTTTGTPVRLRLNSPVVEATTVPISSASESGSRAQDKEVAHGGEAEQSDLQAMKEDFGKMQTQMEKLQEQNERLMRLIEVMASKPAVADLEEIVSSSTAPSSTTSVLTVETPSSTSLSSASTSGPVALSALASSSSAALTARPVVSSALVSSSSSSSSSMSPIVSPVLSPAPSLSTLPAMEGSASFGSGVVKYKPPALFTYDGTQQLDKWWRSLWANAEVRFKLGCWQRIK
jgi:hypothetical protein